MLNAFKHNDYNLLFFKINKQFNIFVRVQHLFEVTFRQLLKVNS